jgi:hypothetical protein
MRSSARLAVAKKRQRFSLGSGSDFEANVAAVAPPGKHIHLAATAKKPRKTPENHQNQKTAERLAALIMFPSLVQPFA